MNQANMVFDTEIFEQLSDIESSLLKILAIMYIPVAATPLAICAHRIGIDDPDTELSFNMNSIRPHLQKMVDLDWVQLHNNRYSCHQDLQNPLLQRAMHDGDFTEIAEQVIESFPPREDSGILAWQSVEHGIAHARLHMFLGDHAKLLEVLDSLYARYTYSESILNSVGFYPAMFGDPIDVELISLLNDETFYIVCNELSYTGLTELNDISHLWTLMNDRGLSGHADNMDNGDVREFYSILSGQKDLFTKIPETLSLTSVFWRVADSTRQLIEKSTQGSHAEACIAQYETAIDCYRELKSLKKSYPVAFNTELEKFYLLALVAHGDAVSLKKATQFLKRVETDIDHSLLAAYSEALETGLFNFTIDSLHLRENTFTPLFYALITFWLNQSLTKEIIEIIEAQYLHIKTNNYAWLAAEYATILSLFSEDEAIRDSYKLEAKQQHLALETQSLFDLVKPQAEWERALNALNRLSTPTNASNDTEERVVWILDKDRYGEYFITPKVQKKSQKGAWTKGRNIALKRLVNERQEFPMLSQHDIKLCDCIIEQQNYDSYHSEGAQFYIEMNTAWLALVDHPAIYWDQARGVPLEITQSDFELLVSEEGDNLRISFYPPFSKDKSESRYLIHKETPTRLCIYQKNEQVYRLSEILSDGLVIPRAAEQNLRETLTSLAPMIKIQSDLEGVSDATEVPSNARIHANLLPYEEGLRATLRIQAFGDFGPLYPPGEGRAKLLVEHNGETFKTHRDLVLERQKLDNLLLNSNVLGDIGEYEDEYLLDDPQDCLELLEQLREQGDDVIIAWPEGEVMRVSSRFDINNMRLNINKSGDWFQLDGNIETDQGLVISLRQLLELSEKSKGRFIELGDGEYVSLTNKFRKKLDAIRSYSEINGEGTLINGLAAYALDDFLSDVGELTVDSEWQEHVNRLEHLEETVHTVPSTLQTELRDYQEDGFQWLSRLAEWGVGACLADDMGLGKTIQTLALLLQRGGDGSALVVAPTSVCNNWETETQKFAPTLNPIMYRGNNRQEIIETASKRDLVIVTYGLLQQDSELFLDKKWHTIVLDEAQAIKNVSAKRTRTAHQLNGDFKLVTTGTPIENHLGELWSLFRFLNPGLLGSQDQFMKRYMIPIERNNDSDVRQHLKRLIQAFMLRRLKTEVLDELPPKTEITVKIPLSDKERAMYEAVRQKAIQNLSAKDKQEGKGSDHLKVLAAITKLRLASCHPRLIMPESTLPSSKLERFAELVEELCENKHKALVFSQFVKHLSIIREYLDEKGINYQYLDGSTPAAQRKKRVEDFQNGIGELFLISLKAGGSGLNLTAADYVIHMDPWWNPAVEDQASDRAHRIGQTRPVTIYRLVAENTIEEKIVKLHQHKRDLANSLLEGSNMSGSMSATDMLALIQEG
ncbi:MAG TPA: DEAD/DEAH box helicase [Leucothrix mucor]|nr:DEAD/DEAH box helicase [Leucothrix mucor]